MAVFAELTPLWGAIVLSIAGWAWAKHLVAVAHRRREIDFTILPRKGEERRMARVGEEGDVLND